MGPVSGGVRPAHRQEPVGGGQQAAAFEAQRRDFAGFAAITFVHFGFGHDANMIMIGDIMLLIPGLMLVNSVREMLCGDIMSGLLRLLESIVLALSIACGFAVAIMTLGSIW